MCPPCDRRHTDPLTTPRSAPTTLCSALHSGQTTTLREKGRNPGYLRAQTVTFWGLRTISSNLRAISRTHAPLSALLSLPPCQSSQGRAPADPGQHRDRRDRRVSGYPWKGGTEEGGRICPQRPLRGPSSSQNVEKVLPPFETGSGPHRACTLQYCVIWASFL